MQKLLVLRSLRNFTFRRFWVSVSEWTFLNEIFCVEVPEWAFLSERSWMDVSEWAFLSGIQTSERPFRSFPEWHWHSENHSEFPEWYSQFRKSLRNLLSGLQVSGNHSEFSDCHSGIRKPLRKSWVNLHQWRRLVLFLNYLHWNNFISIVVIRS